MKYNFDEIIDRYNTNSLKYDFKKERNMPLDVNPFWVADMDFKSLPEISEALIERCNHGIYGYSEPKQDYYDALKKWYKDRFDFSFKENEVVITPGIVFAICTAITAFTEENQGVMIQKPVYYPFSSSIEMNNRKIVNNHLVYEDGKYKIDFKDFENQIKEDNVKLFILCNPHNPVGKVWSKEELTLLGEICLRNNVLVISDEIHSDFVYEGFKHTVFSEISEKFAEITITCTSPSKTFNLAGLQLSNIIIKNNKILKKFKKELHKTGYTQPNIMGLISAQAAYTHGAKWVDELLVYLKNNIELAKEIIKEIFPTAHVINPEGTYLLWIDFRSLGIPAEKLDKLIVEKAKLWLDGGTMFGQEGDGFQRINIACPKESLKKALYSLKNIL